MNKTRKSLQDLNLLDRFLFAQVMEDPDTVQTFLELLLGEEIMLRQQPQTEKEQRTSPLNRYVKLDVWAEDTEDVVYDAEVQKENTKNLPKRSRYYQALIDCNLLPPGTVDFNQLRESYIIIISPFDPFGYGRYQYTFVNQCKEVSELLLEDGAVRIFFNTRGHNDGETRPELIELLRFMEHTAELAGQQSEDPRIRKLQRRVEVVKASEQIGVRYMQAWEERVMDRQEARAEGLEIGREEGREEVREEAQRQIDKINLLNTRLVQSERIDDLMHAAKDPEFREQLFKEFGI